MSFSDRIDGQSVGLHQPNSVMTKYFAEKRMWGDLVEFLGRHVDVNNKKRKYDAFLLKKAAMGDSDSRAIGFDSLWEMPRDTLSILQFQLSRSRLRYVSSAGGAVSPSDWVENRLLLLLMADTFASFSGALGTCLLRLAASDPDIVKKIILPKGRILGTARVGEKMRIVQLPGRQTVYFISSKPDAELDQFFGAPEDDVQLFSKLLRQCLLQTKTLSTGLFAGMVTKVVEKALKIVGRATVKPRRGFRTVSRGSAGDFLSLSIDQAIRLYEIRKRDGWTHLDLGGLIVVVQLFKKSKTVRSSS
jgi:hypothetical protein